MLGRALAPATFSAAIGLTAVLGSGQPVLAMRSPLSLGSTVTTGVISALHRAASIAVDPDHVLNSVPTDAALNPGSSGGALVNIDGKPIGAGPAITQLGGAVHIGDGVARQRGAESTTEPSICFRRICNPKG
jgi:S1-C subfamily serine protease